MSDSDFLQSTRSGAAYRLGRAFKLGTALANEAQAPDGQRCWVKQVPATDEAAIARLRYEAIVLGKLRHPGVIRLLDRGRSHTCFFLVFEPASGAPLPELLGRGPLSVAAALALATHVAELLVAIHGQGICCCTLPPTSLFADNLGRITLADLSGAWDEVSPPRAIEPGEQMSYLSPEQIGGSSVERRSDIYTFGVFLFELLTGRPPFQNASRGELALQHLLSPAPSVQQFRADVPPALAALIGRCLAKAPAQRYPDAAALLAALHDIQQARHAGAPSEPARLLPWVTSPS